MVDGDTVPFDYEPDIRVQAGAVVRVKELMRRGDGCDRYALASHSDSLVHALDAIGGDVQAGGDLFYEKGWNDELRLGRCGRHARPGPAVDVVGMVVAPEDEIGVGNLLRRQQGLHRAALVGLEIGIDVDHRLPELHHEPMLAQPPEGAGARWDAGAVDGGDEAGTGRHGDSFQFQGRVPLSFRTM